ncbi:hypothetical protein EDC04DRAFT_2602706 [Pisolithus marmoratus]|nr:hypothetical protein EDC04DRAFT_2602706 [Pisolithus marmoratus]
MDIYDGVNQWPMDSGGKLTDDHRESILYAVGKCLDALWLIGSDSGGDCCNADCGEEDQANPEGGSHCSMADGQGMQRCWRAVIVAIHMMENKADLLQHTDGKGMQCHQCASMVAHGRWGRKARRAIATRSIERMVENKADPLQHDQWKGCQHAGMVAMWKVEKKSWESHCNTIDRKDSRSGDQCVATWLVGRGYSATSRMQLDCCNVGDKKEDPQSYCNAISGMEW